MRANRRGEFTSNWLAPLRSAAQSARMGRVVVAEGIGTALLVAAVVGSGIMAECLSGGNMAIFTETR